MKTKLNIETWNRKEHFAFFMGLSNPLYSISANIKCTKAKQKTKTEKSSFFAYYLYQSLRAVNSIENFKMRIENNEIYIYDEIHASSTIGRKDETFGFSFIRNAKNFEEFNDNCQSEIQRVQACSGLAMTKETESINTIHYSAIPWISFTSVSPQTSNPREDSIPKIFFGKYFEQNGEFYLPVSVTAHHAFIDGVHMGKFFSTFEAFLAE